MISTIQLKFGSAPNQEHVKLEVAPVTVFVGPNNSGKSKVLQEINNFCKSGNNHPTDDILDSITFVEIPPGQISTIKKDLTLQPHKTRLSILDI